MNTLKLLLTWVSLFNPNITSFFTVGCDQSSSEDISIGNETAFYFLQSFKKILFIHKYN